MIYFILKPQWLIATLVGIGAQSLSAMVNPLKSVGGYRHILTHIPWPSITIAKAYLLITVMLAVAYGVLTGCGPTQAAETGPDTHAPAFTNPLTYDESVRIAIKQSPALTKSSVQIDISRMDESDSRYGMVPPLTFRTYYYVNRPENTSSAKPYSLSFSMDPYNPFGSYYSLQAQKLATQMAILGHLQVISKGLQTLGQYYLELDLIKKTIACQKSIINLDKEGLTFAENRVSIGTGTSLEVRSAQMTLRMSQNELEQLQNTEKRRIANLKHLLGLPPSAEFTPDLRDSRRQVLGNFNPATVSIEQAKKNSYEMKALDIQKQLQGYKILLAKVKVFPSLLFTTQTPDPLNTTAAWGLYVSVGLEIPVWDGFKRIREVSRQKAVLKQLNAHTEEKVDSLENLFYAAMDDLQTKSEALKMGQSSEELTRLNANQTEIRYRSGEVTLPVYLESRKQVVDAQKKTLKNNFAYDEAVLRLRELVGDLSKTYVDANSWQK